MESRLEPLRRVCVAHSLDALVLVPGANFAQLFAEDLPQQERALLAVVPRTGRPRALLPALEREALDAAEVEIHPWIDAEGPAPALRELAERCPLRRVGVEGRQMRVFVSDLLAAAWPGVEIVDAGDAIDALRSRKDATELDALRRAVRVTETALGDILDSLRVGETEQAVRGRLLAALYSAGAEGLSFPPIVAAGEGSARPHAVSRSDYPIREGDALLFDLGARVGGFCADITRTVYVGHVTDRQAAVHATVLAANRAAIERIRPGVPAGEIDAAATARLERSPFAQAIRHRTGHGIGREVHEAPWIVRGDDTPLAPGMVFTVEPGLYLEGEFGVRIEEDVLVTDDGAELLTRFPCDARVVPGTA